MWCHTILQYCLLWAAVLHCLHMTIYWWPMWIYYFRKIQTAHNLGPLSWGERHNVLVGPLDIVMRLDFKSIALIRWFESTPEPNKLHSEACKTQTLSWEFYKPIMELLQPASTGPLRGGTSSSHSSSQECRIQDGSLVSGSPNNYHLGEPEIKDSGTLESRPKLSGNFLMGSFCFASCKNCGY